MRVAEKIALVTGGAHGIGAATCRRLAEEGARVLVTDIDGDAAAACADALGAKGLSARALSLDVASEAQWIATLEDILANEGRLDILVNNAGTVVAGPVDELSLADWDFVQSVNLRGVFLGLKHGIRAMRPGGGAIVNVASIKSMVGSSGYAAYDASKGGVRSLTKAAALRCAEQKFGIRVNSVHPGFVITDLGRGGLDDREMQKIREEIARLHPIGRLADPAEIASAILFLASDEASFVTGAELVVDGGYTAQ